MSTDTPASIPLSFSAWSLPLWRASADHIAYARDLFTQPKFRDLLAVLHNLRCESAPVAVTDTQAAILLGQRQGYDQMLGALLALTEFPETPKGEVESDYGAGEFNLDRNH